MYYWQPMRFCIIYILLVPLCILLPNFSSLCFYHTVGEAVCEGNPARSWCQLTCEHSLAGSCSCALAQGPVSQPDSPRNARVAVLGGSGRCLGVWALSGREPQPAPISLCPGPLLPVLSECLHTLQII